MPQPEVAHGGDALRGIFLRQNVVIVAIVLLALMTTGFVLLRDPLAALSTLTLMAVAAAMGWWQLWR